MATSPRSTTTKTTAKAAPAKAAASAATEASTAEDAPKAADATVDQLGVKDLVERVMAQSDLKKKDVKPVVEATLAVLGEALAAGQALNLPPFGKLRINRKKDGPKGETMTLRLRRGGAKAGQKGSAKAKEALAETEE